MKFLLISANLEQPQGRDLDSETNRTKLLDHDETSTSFIINFTYHYMPQGALFIHARRPYQDHYTPGLFSIFLEYAPRILGYFRHSEEKCSLAPDQPTTIYFPTWSYRAPLAASGPELGSRTEHSLFAPETISAWYQYAGFMSPNPLPSAYYRSSASFPLARAQARSYRASRKGPIG